MNDEQERPETGGMRFGDDWRGVFIRGDDAINYYLHLISLIKGQSRKTESEGQVIALAQLTNLAYTLYQACKTQLPNLPPIATKCQEMKPFEGAKAS